MYIPHPRLGLEPSRVLVVTSSSDEMQSPLLQRNGAQDEAQLWSEDSQEAIRNPSFQEQDPRASTTSSWLPPNALSEGSKVETYELLQKASGNN